MKRTLYLHVGHGKTGSSWLQSLFAINAEALQQIGIKYPTEHVNDNDNAIQGKTTSGNAYGWARDPFILDEKLTRLGSDTPDSVLLSSEWLFDEIIGWSNADPDNSYPMRLDEVVRKHGFEDISVLLFIRNPISHASSLWQQVVKRHGETRQFADFLKVLKPFPPRVALFLDILEQVTCAQVFVRNYSLVGSDLVSTTSDWLGIDKGLLELPPVKIVNRSLTLGELELQRHLNIELGPSGELWSNPVCEELPNLKADIFPISPKDQMAHWESLADWVQNVNSRIEESQGYKLDQICDGPQEENFMLNSAQMAVLARSFKTNEAAQTAALRAALTNSDALRADRDALRADRDALRADRDALSAARDALITQQEANFRERDILIARRNSLKTECDELRSKPLRQFCKRILNKAQNLKGRDLRHRTNIPNP